MKYFYKTLRYALVFLYLAFMLSSAYIQILKGRDILLVMALFAILVGNYEVIGLGKLYTYLENKEIASSFLTKQG